jgi:hypothetical protein
MMKQGDKVVIKIAYPVSPFDRMIDGQCATVERRTANGAYAVRLATGAVVEVAAHEMTATER